MLTRKTLAAALAVACLCSGGAFAAGIPLHMKAHVGACPTAVEKPGAAGQVVAHPELMNQEKKGAVAADAKTKSEAAPPAKGQDGLLLPAVKQGSAAGQ